MRILILLLSIIAACFAFTSKDSPPPAPYGAIPTADQLQWQKMEYYMFIHFGTNTFTDKEWGEGTEDPAIFNPSSLDARQWAATAKAAGMKGIIITAKHHDGFCLWPSKYSSHTVKQSRWKNGNGDVLRELSQACREYGIKMGVYLSPWDRNHPAYGTPEYNDIFANTLTEVLSGYGDIFEQWFDGANGDKAKRQIYDWSLFNGTVRKNQPHAVVFSDVGPGCRWIGNEKGYAGETNWSRLNTAGFTPGHGAPPSDTLNHGNVHGQTWLPSEADVSIRPGWFYSPSTDNQVKTVDQLLDIYFSSVGRNANLLLNVPVDRRGLIHANDSTRLMELRNAINLLVKDNKAAKAKVKASDTRRGRSFSASNMTDSNADTYWAASDNVNKAWIEIDMGKQRNFSMILLQENIALGQRIANFDIQYWNHDKTSWQTISKATTVGYKRILRFPSVTSDRVRINITRSLACPTISNIEVY